MRALGDLSGTGELTAERPEERFSHPKPIFLSDTSAASAAVCPSCSKRARAEQRRDEPFAIILTPAFGSNRRPVRRPQSGLTSWARRSIDRSGLFAWRTIRLYA
jgi:uncharacterized Zn-finger protein